MLKAGACASSAVGCQVEWPAELPVEGLRV